MEINVSDINSELSNLNKILEEYENNCLNLYNEISSVSDYWNDGNSKKFFDNIKIQKQDSFKYIEEVKMISDVYSYIVKNYQLLGNKIRINLGYKNNVINCLNNYYSKIDNIIKQYDSLEIIDEREILNNQENNLINSRNNILKIKEKYIEIFEKIEEIEKQVSLKLSKINLPILKNGE